MEKFRELPQGMKVGLLITIATIAGLLALFVASNIALLCARQHDGELHVFTVLSLLGGDDVRAAKAAKIGLMIGAAAVGALLIKLFSSGPMALHGQARFASESEIKKAGLREKIGLIIGKFKGRFLVFGGTEHLMVYAPTRSGKGVGIVIPNLLNWPDSCIVSDIKKENWKLTAGFRAAHGQAVYLFDPLDPEGRTARYNPLGYVRRENEADLYDDLQRIASILYPPEGKDPFWSNAARSGFMGIAGYVAETPELPLTMGEVLRQIAVQDCQAHFKKQIADREKTKPLSTLCKTALNDFIGTSENTFQSIRKTISAKLELWLNPRIDAATAENDFDLRELRRKRMSIYLGVTPDNLERLAPLLNLFFQQAVDLNIRTLPEHDPTLKYKVMLMMDEFAALGMVSVIVKGIAYVAGYGLRIVTILQSPSQLRSIYGPDEAKNYMTNHAIEVIYTPKEQEDANAISERFGYDTVKGKSQSRGLGLSKSSKNETTSDQRRALMLPQELTMTPMSVEYILKGGVRPIKADKIFYYKDPAFKPRLMPAPVIPSLTARNQKPEPEPGATASADSMNRVVAELAEVKALLKETLAARAPTLEEIVKPSQPADGSDGKTWAMPTDLDFSDLPLELPEPDLGEAVEVKLEAWLGSLAA